MKNCLIMQRLKPVLALALVAIQLHAAQESKEQWTPVQLKQSTLSFPAKKITNHISCTLLATPEDQIIDKIADDIRAVERNGYVCIESPSLSNQIIINALIEARLRGATIKIFVNDPNKENNLELANRYRNTYKNLKTKNDITIIELPNLHAKRIVIAKNISARDQGTIVYLGSLNMTENSPYNYEIMARCTDYSLFKESFEDQHRLEKGFYNHAASPIDFNTRRIIHSSDPHAHTAKKKIIEDFSLCPDPHDFLYFAAYTLDDPEIVDTIIQARKMSDKPIKVILDGAKWNEHKTNIIKPLVLANVDVYIFNKDGNKKTPANHPKSMHIKAILRQCDQKCLTLISTANFTPTGKHDINHDLWEPCSLAFSHQLKNIFDAIIEESEKLETPQEMGQKILKLMKDKELTLAAKTEILRLITAGADVNQTSDPYGNTPLFIAINNNHDDIAKTLLKASANPNIAGDYQNATLWTPAGSIPPLILAVIKNKIELVTTLFSAGADINAKDRLGKTAFDYAIGKPQILNLLNDVKFAREHADQIMAD